MRNSDVLVRVLMVTRIYGNKDEFAGEARQHGRFVKCPFDQVRSIDGAPLCVVLMAC